MLTAISMSAIATNGVVPGVLWVGEEWPHQQGCHWGAWERAHTLPPPSPTILGAREGRESLAWVAARSRKLPSWTLSGGQWATVVLSLLPGCFAGLFHSPGILACLCQWEEPPVLCPPRVGAWI